MKLPRDVSGAKLLWKLERLGYAAHRQRPRVVNQELSDCINRQACRTVTNNKIFCQMRL